MCRVSVLQLQHFSTTQSTYAVETLRVQSLKDMCLSLTHTQLSSSQDSNTAIPLATVNASRATPRRNCNSIQHAKAATVATAVRLR
jgi:hypothetical protein